jgi:hypothetical protein
MCLTNLNVNAKYSSAKCSQVRALYIRYVVPWWCAMVAAGPLALWPHQGLSLLTALDTHAHKREARTHIKYDVSCSKGGYDCRVGMMIGTCTIAKTSSFVLHPSRSKPSLSAHLSERAVVMTLAVVAHGTTICFLGMVVWDGGRLPTGHAKGVC